MHHPDSIMVSADFVFMGVGFLLLSFGLKRTKYYTASAFLASAIVKIMHMSGLDVTTLNEWAEDVSILVCVLLVTMAMVNYARLQLRGEVDATNSMPSRGNGPSHF